MQQDDSSASPIDLGIAALDASPAWHFFPTDDRVVGQPLSGVGVMQIVRLQAANLPAQPTHEQCMAAALAAAGYERDAPGIHRAKEYEDDCIAGGESFDIGADRLRVWYRHCPDGMLAAWFACPIDRARERSVVESMRQCDKMVATLRVPPPMA